MLSVGQIYVKTFFSLLLEPYYKFVIFLNWHQQDIRKEKPTNREYDWTYLTKYKGTVANFPVIEDPAAKINIEKLKLREAIHYYRDIRFLDDELDDNGQSSIGLKIRVMPSCFFILLRHYLRVDKGQ